MRSLIEARANGLDRLHSLRFEAENRRIMNEKYGVEELIVGDYLAQVGKEEEVKEKEKGVFYRNKS